jgi:type IV secretory pathway VirJ component
MSFLLAALLATLPLVERAAPKPVGTLMILMSGDGGWATIDRQLTARFNGAGIDVVGLDAQSYLWKRRSADELSAAIASIAEHYGETWRERRIVLAGYSRGADLMPFAVTRLPAPIRKQVALVVLLTPSRMSSFELHLSDFFRDGGSVPVVPEMEKLRNHERVLCLYGSDERDSSACTAFSAPNIQRMELRGGHHFDGDYGQLADAIIKEIGR